MNPAIQKIARGLVVSCQASEGEPLAKPEHIAALSLTALNGGAVALRLEGLANIAHLRALVDVPIIGLIKSASVPDDKRLDSVYITSTLEEGVAIAGAGADVVALDATGRPRPDGLSLESTIAELHRLGCAVWADVSTFEEGMNAATCGADVISTTMYGYTRQTQKPEEAPPDFDLLAALVKHTGRPVVLEGRVWRTDDVTKAFELGSHAVVVGSAITRPQLITRRFVNAIPAVTSSAS